MDYLAIAGFSCLGGFVGLIVGWFVNQEREIESKGLASILVAAGSVLASFVPFFSPKGGQEFWFYPIALLIALLIAPFLDIAYNWLYGLAWVTIMRS